MVQSASIIVRFFFFINVTDTSGPNRKKQILQNGRLSIMNDGALHIWVSTGGGTMMHDK